MIFFSTHKVLSEQSYVHDDEIYRIKFINKALSGQTREYTISTVFKVSTAPQILQFLGNKNSAGEGVVGLGT